MTDVVIAGYGPISSYGANIDRDPGVSGPGEMVIAVTWFYSDGTPSVVGEPEWNVIAQTSDLRGTDETSTAILSKTVADASLEPSSYQIGLTAGGDQRGRCYFLANTDASSPVAGSSVVANPLLSTITVPDVSVSRPGSISILGCGSWDFAVWQLSGSGGTQIPPSGFTSFEPANSSEFGDFYETSLPVGNVGGSFGTPAPRFAVVQVVFQPAATGSSQAANSQFFAAASG